MIGGGTRSGFLSDAILQLIALPLLVVALWSIWDVPLSKTARWACRLTLAIVALPLLQLVPLPPAVWTSLPGRQPIVEVFELLGSELPWMPLSVSPRATWLASLSILPPTAIFLGILLLDDRERRVLSLIILAIGGIGVFVGLIQVAQGPASPLRFFEFSNPREAVGFFANRNHFAASLYCLTLFAAAWAAVLFVGQSGHTRRYETANIAALAACFTLLVALVAAQAMARSRAGLGLTLAALVGAFSLIVSERGSSSEGRTTKLLAGVFGLAVIFPIQFALYRVLERFTSDPIADARVIFGHNTADAAKAFMPLGSGVGSFTSVYAMFEKPQNTIANIYVNRAHNDFLEVWLESGLAGIALIGLFVAWLGTRVVAVYGRTSSVGSSADIALARAAAIAVVLLIAHSVVDYPLRTGSMMALMAFACALLVEPQTPAGRKTTAPTKRARRYAQRPSSSPPTWPSYPSPAMVTPVTGGSAHGDGGLSGSDIEWPIDWREPKA